MAKKSKKTPAKTKAYAPKMAVQVKKSKRNGKSTTTTITTTTTVVKTVKSGKNQPTKKPVPKRRARAAPKRAAVVVTPSIKAPKKAIKVKATPPTPPPKIPAKKITASSSTDDSKLVKGISKGGAIVDVHIPSNTDYHVVQDTKNAFNGKCFDATLNCSDLGHNNNKFYIIQMLAKDSDPNIYYVWNRWGRVGVPGQNAFSSGLSYDSAVKMFMDKYKAKTSTKYTLIDIDYSNKDKEPEVKPSKKKVKESKLPKKVQDFINLIYNLNLMKVSMMEVGYDANKMPLGKLGSKTIKEGYNVLKAIETELRGKRNSKVLIDLSSDFFTLIPHNFGFQ